MNTVKLIGEIIGIVAILEGFLIFLSSKREKILLYKFISDAFWTVNQLLLGGYTGAFLNALGMGREAVFYNRDKRKWASSPLWLWFFLAVTAASPIVSMVSGKEGAYALLPALGSIFAVIGFYSRNPAFTRSISFLANGLWLVYNIWIHNYSASVSGVILLLSAAVGTVHAWRQKRRSEKQEIEEEPNT